MLNLLDTPNASSGAKARESASIVKSLKDSATKAIPVIGLDDEKNKLLELISLLKLDEATLQKAHAFLPIKVVLSVVHRCQSILGRVCIWTKWSRKNSVD